MEFPFVCISITYLEIYLTHVWWFDQDPPKPNPDPCEVINHTNPVFLLVGITIGSLWHHRRTKVNVKCRWCFKRGPKHHFGFLLIHQSVAKILQWTLPKHKTCKWICYDKLNSPPLQILFAVVQYIILTLRQT